MIKGYEDLDFTVTKYRMLCEAIRSSGYASITLREYFWNEKLPPRFVILRHDIDRMPHKALSIAGVEKEYGLRASYYFRSNDNVFKPDIIRGVLRLGHEIGYHYEVLSRANGDPVKAIGLFEQDLKRFRQICDVDTICMHGAPLSPHDNRKIWDHYDFTKYGIIGEAYLSVRDSIPYFSDTGMAWNRKNNLRDHMSYQQDGARIDTTDDLIRFVKSDPSDRLYILTHPERWSENTPEWGIFFVKDQVVNVGKKMLTVVRS